MRINDDNDALLVVDVQNDFCPGGALAVPGGDGVVNAINRIQPSFRHLVFSRDWHPNDHCSFADDPAFTDMSWPVHCVQDSMGAEFHGSLHVPGDATVISKGMDPDREEYSAFAGKELETRLRDIGIMRLFLAGLATDYCVKFTALDAREAGFQVVLVEDACRGITDETVQAALREMRDAGVQTVASRELA